MTNQVVAGSMLPGYIVNVMRSPVIERLMGQGSQGAFKQIDTELKDGSTVVTWIAG